MLYEVITGKNAETTAVVRYFSGIKKIFLQIGVELRVGILEDVFPLKKIFYWVKNIGVSANFHGNIGEAVDFGVDEIGPDSIKNYL